ncbi:MAG: oligosaccharide flippase family protein [Planctomycetales bacterium]|nr:oligosaccharide flippase family protein [Planctomycetales bacterium]
MMDAASVRKRVGLNTVSLWMAKLAQICLGIVLTPLLLLELGKEGYGVCAIAMTIQSLAMIADLRIRVALARELAAALTNGEHERASRLASSGMVVYLALGTLMAAVCGLAAPWLAHWFNVSPALLDDTVALIRWYGGASILLSFLQPVYSSALAARNRFDLTNYTELAVTTSRGIVMIAVLILSTRDLLAWGVVMVLFQTVSVLAQRRLAMRVVPQIERRWALMDLRLFGSVLSLGGSLFLLRLAQLFSETLDPIILTAFLGPGAVALYRPGLSLVRMAGPFVQTLREQLHPLTTNAHVAGDTQRLQRLLIVGTRYTILLAIPVYTVLFVFAQPIIDVWVGRALGEEAIVSARVLMGLAVVEMTVCLGGSQFPVLMGANAVGFVVKLQLPLAVLNLIVSVLLVGYTPLGVFGVVVATIALTLVRRPLLTIYSAHVAGLTTIQYLRQAYLWPCVVLLIVAPFALALKLLFLPKTLPWLIASAVLTSAIWLVATWKIGLVETDRVMFRHLISSFRLRRRNSATASAEEPSPTGV